MTREFWDAEAAAFDDEPDHGLRDPATREAWRQLLAAHLPAGARPTWPTWAAAPAPSPSCWPRPGTG